MPEVERKEQLVQAGTGDIELEFGSRGTQHLHVESCGLIGDGVQEGGLADPGRAGQEERGSP